MSGPIPDSVREKMLPMPPDFRPVVQQDNDRMWWRGRVTTKIGDRVDQLQVEYGFSKRSGQDASEIKRVAWEIHELARLGRGDLISYARQDRHTARAVTKPTITAENMNQGLAALVPPT